MPGLDVSIEIAAPSGRVLKAFFDPDALGAWWQVARSITMPRTLGAWVLEWSVTEFRDDVLGRLGGVLRGTVMQFDPGAGFFVADLYYLPPDGEPIGPMALEVTCAQRGEGTHVRLKQTGFEEGPRWRRYYELVTVGYERALSSLKSLLEK